MCGIDKFLQLAYYEPLMHVLISIHNVLIWHICVFRRRWWCKEGVCSCTHTCACLHPHAHEYVFPGHSHSSLSACTGKMWSLAHEHVSIIHDKSQKSFKGVNMEKSIKSCMINVKMTGTNVKNVLVFRQKPHPSKVRRHWLIQVVWLLIKNHLSCSSRFLCLFSCPQPCRGQSRLLRPSMNWKTKCRLSCCRWLRRSQRTRSQVHSCEGWMSGLKH